MEIAPPTNADPRDAPKYKAELFSASMKLECCGLEAIARCCCRVNRPEPQIAQTTIDSAPNPEAIA